MKMTTMLVCGLSYFPKKITNFQAFHWGISSSIRPLISEEYPPLEYTYIL